MSNNGLNVYSEIGRLKKVLLHRPGEEIENLTPELMERLLFDDIPYLKIAREEHDAFAQIFRDNGVEVFYLEELMAETLENGKAKAEFVDEFISEAGLASDNLKDKVKEFYADNDKMLKELIDPADLEPVIQESGPQLAHRQRRFCPGCFKAGQMATSCNCGESTLDMDYYAQPPKVRASKTKWKRFFRQWYPEENFKERWKQKNATDS